MAFLDHPARFVNIVQEFDALDPSGERYHLKSFDYWIGKHSSDRYHRWDPSQQNGKYTECMTFRNVSKGERLYGFVCTPKADDQDFEMCVLVMAAQKKRNQTDFAELDRVQRMRVDPDVENALRDPDLFLKGVGSNE